jgi:hypothetical protein
VNVDEIGPSTPLAPYTLRHPEVFVGHIAWLAPGRMPRATVHLRVIDQVMLVVLLLSWIGLGIGYFGSLPYVTIICAPAAGVLLAWNQLVYPHSQPRAVSFGSLTTFRELAECLAENDSGRSFAATP